MPPEHVPRTLLSLSPWLALGGLIAALGGCGATTADATTRSAGAAEASAKVPITTASADAKALYLRGRVFIDQLRPKDGRTLFEQAVAIDPTFAMAHYSLALSAPTAKVRTDEMHAAVAQSGAVSDGERLMILSLQARVNAEPAKALQYTEQLVAEFPGDERAHLSRGVGYFAEQAYGKAIADFKRAIEIDSGFAPAYNMLGYGYRAAGMNDAAEAAYKKYIQLIPSDPNPHDSYAEFLMKTGRFDESIAQYEQALSIDPHFSASRLGIAADRMFKGEQDQAIAEAQQLYDVARDDADRRQALFSKAETEVDAGKTEQALTLLSAALALDARIADTAAMSADAVALGDVLLEGGKPDAARVKYAQALDLVIASSQSADVKEDTKLADRYNMARVALARREWATAEAGSAAYTSGANAAHNAVRIRQAHELAGLIALNEQKFGPAGTELAQADQQDPYVLYARARAYRGAGDVANAAAMGRAAANAYILPTLPYAFIRMKAKAMS